MLGNSARVFVVVLKISVSSPHQQDFQLTWDVMKVVVRSVVILLNRIMP